MLVVAAFGAPAGVGCPYKELDHGLWARNVPRCRWSQFLGRQWETISLKRNGITGMGDGVSRPAGGRSFQGTYGGWRPSKGAGSRAGGTNCPTVPVVATFGAPFVGLLKFAATLRGSSGHRDSCSALPHCLGAAGSGSPLVHCHIAGEQCAVDLLQYAATLLGVVGSRTPSIHRHNAGEKWVVHLPWYTAILMGGSGQWASFNILPHWWGVVGNGSPLPVGARDCPAKPCFWSFLA